MLKLSSTPPTAPSSAGELAGVPVTEAEGWGEGVSPLAWEKTALRSILGVLGLGEVVGDPVNELEEGWGAAMLVLVLVLVLALVLALALPLVLLGGAGTSTLLQEEAAPER